MKRRVLCLFLTVIMLSTLFLTSCGESDDTVTETRNNVTLNLYGIKNESTTQDAVDAVTKKLNNITESKFRTTVKFFLYSEEEYAAKLEAASNSGENIPDIFLLEGSDMFSSYYNDGKLLSLTDSLSITAKLITDYVHPALINTAKIGKDVYAIPVNKMVGKTTYYIVDKNVAEKYNLNTSRIKDISDFYFFLQSIKQSEPDYVPMVLSGIDVPGFDFFFGSDYLVGKKNSEIDAFQEPSISESFLSAFKEDSLSVQYCEYLRNFKNEGLLYNTIPAGKKAAVQVANLTETEFNEQFGDEKYARIIYKHPRTSSEEALEYSYAINSATSNASRAAEVLNLLFTNESYHNLFTFGIEGENYKVNDDGKISMLNDTYSMNFYASGNTLIGHIPEYESINYQLDAVKNNQNLMTSAFVGFTYTLTPEELSELQEYRSIISYYFNDIFSGSQSYLEQINAAEAQLETLGFNEFVSNINDKYAEYAESLGN